MYMNYHPAPPQNPLLLDAPHPYLASLAVARRGEIQTIGGDGQGCDGPRGWVGRVDKHRT